MNNFGMIEKYHALRKNAWCGIWSKRILSELYYLIEASRVNDNTHSALLQQAVDRLYAHVQEKGAIEREIALSLEQELAPMKALAKKYQVILVGHAHIDMNWTWGFQETANIVVDTFETVLKLMEEYPQFKFSQSQAAVYKILEEYKPELLCRVKEKIHEGRWEVTASTWVENDKNLSGSEAQVRQILQTKKYLSALLELPEEALNLDFEPDTFGHPQTLPELFSQAGIKYYYHCRGNDENYAYRWQAPSGARVLTYREPIWYNDRCAEYDCLGFVPSFCDMHGLTCAMKVYGVGDHGGGPTRQQLNHLQEMQSWPLMPEMKFGFLRDFFAELEKVQENLPLVDRELNYIYTGCYTSEGRIKRANKIGEDRLFEAEALDVMAHTALEHYTTPSDFGKAWEPILFNQFHDILPGSGVFDTTCHALGQFQQSMATAQVNMKDAMTALSAKMDTTCFGAPDEALAPIGAGAGFGTGDTWGYQVSGVDRSSGSHRIFSVFNPTQYARKDLILLTLWDWEGDVGQLYALDASGKEHSCQFLREGTYYANRYYQLLLDAEVPPMGYATFMLKERKKDCLSKDWSAFRICGNVANPPVLDRITDEPLVLENEKVRAEFSQGTMKLISFIDKESGKELIDKPACGFRLITENTEQGMPAWRVGTYMKEEDLNETQAVRYLSCSKGALRQLLQYEFSFGRSRVRITVSLDRGSSILEFTTQVFWYELGSPSKGIPQLNFSVPLGYQASDYLCNIPMGVAVRRELAQDVPSIGFMAGIPETGERSLMVLSDCKYGFRGNNNTISMPLFRGSFSPDPAPDQGMHMMRFGVGIAKPQPEKINEAYECFIHPMSSCTNQIHEGQLPATDSLLQLSGNARLQCIKRSEDKKSIILRLHNIEKTPQQITVSCKAPISGMALTDICESRDIPLSVKGSACTFTLEGGALRTVKLILSR